MRTPLRPLRSLRLVLPVTAILVAGPSLLSCSVKAPPRSAWTIVAGDVDGEDRASSAAPSLGVTRFSAAPELRRTDLVWRSEDGRKLNQSDDRWVDYPDRMLEEIVHLSLRQSGSFSSVRGVPPASGLDAVLHARVLDFSEWHDGGNIVVKVAIDWRLTRPGGETMAQDIVRTSAQPTHRSVAGAVVAYQEASREAARELASRVGQLLAESPRQGAPRAP